MLDLIIGSSWFYKDVLGRVTSDIPTPSIALTVTPNVPTFSQTMPHLNFSNFIEDPKENKSDTLTKELTPTTISAPPSVLVSRHLSLNLPYHRVHLDHQDKIHQLITTPPNHNLTHLDLSPYMLPSLPNPQTIELLHTGVINLAPNRAYLQYRFLNPRLQDMINLIIASSWFYKDNSHTNYLSPGLTPLNPYQSVYRTNDGFSKYSMLALTPFSILSAVRRAMNHIVCPSFDLFFLVHLDGIHYKLDHSVKCLLGDNPSNLHVSLFIVRFARRSSVGKLILTSSFDIVHGFLLTISLNPNLHTLLDFS